MKKTALFLVLAIILASGVAYAEELMITLNSGNTIVVHYTGTIQGVTLKGTSDGIAGVSMANPASPALPTKKQHESQKNPQDSTQKQPVVSQTSKKEEQAKQPEKDGLFRWADPIRED